MGDIERVQPKYQIRPVQRDHLRILPNKEERQTPHRDPQDVVDLHEEEVELQEELEEGPTVGEPHHIDLSA